MKIPEWSSQSSLLMLLWWWWKKRNDPSIHWIQTTAPVNDGTKTTRMMVAIVVTIVMITVKNGRMVEYSYYYYH